MKGDWRTLFRRFCLDGSVVGLKYFYLFPDKFSRCFWLVWVLFILYFAGCLTYLLYRRFEAMPTRITIENQFEPVGAMPYPAITLCTPNQMTISAVRHFDRTLVTGNRSSDLTNTLQQLLGFYHFIKIEHDELSNLDKLVDLNRYTVPEMLVQLPQSCNRFLRVCVFRSRLYPRCHGLFRALLTKHGLCCIFNSAYHYKSKSRNERDERFTPQLAGLTGVTNGLTVITDYEPADAVDYTIHHGGATRAEKKRQRCTVWILKFSGVFLDRVIGDHLKSSEDARRLNLHNLYIADNKVMFTDWTEFPADDESLLLAPNTESFHMMHITATYCSSDVQELPSDRCLFDYERSLPYFRHYRNSDCDLLCLASVVEDRCRCLLPHLPHLHAQKVCPITAIPCITETKLNMNEWLENQQCECPRDCDSRVYRVDSSIGNLDSLPYLCNTHFPSADINKSSSVMHFLFPTPVYKKQKQETVMSLTTLASNLGGVFGLCLGCSVMSVLEVWFYAHSAARNCVRARLRRGRVRGRGQREGSGGSTDRRGRRYLD